MTDKKISEQNSAVKVHNIANSMTMDKTPEGNQTAKNHNYLSARRFRKNDIRYETY